MMSRAGMWIWNAMSMMLLISIMAGCASDRKVRNADPQETSGLPNASDEATRGIHVEGRLGLDQVLQVRPSKNAVPHELHDGDEVKAGDRIRATIMTSEDAYLYLAFCASHELAVYPSQRGVRTQAGIPKLVPEGDRELVIDGEPGSEVLYIIVSRTELSLADPHLAAALATAGKDANPVDCGTGLDADLAKPAHHGGSTALLAPSPTTNLLRGDRVPKKRMPGPAGRNVRQQNPKTSAGSGSSNDHGKAQPFDAGVHESPQDEPDFIRSPGTIVWYGADGVNGPGEVVAADPDGIAVVRYRFTHVTSTSPP